jgi:hypothetical protein
MSYRPLILGGGGGELFGINDANFEHPILLEAAAGAQTMRKIGIFTGLSLSQV